jgi:hypothetical protein
MNVQRKISINTPVSRLWSILADDYDKVGEWTTAVEASAPNPDVPEGEGRVCATGFGENRETITHSDSEEHTFTYQVEFAKPPFFLERILNSWSVDAGGDGQSVVQMNADVQLKPIIGAIMGPFLKRGMHRRLDKILDELKYYAETGQIHPRKQEQIKTRSLQAA